MDVIPARAGIEASVGLRCVDVGTGREGIVDVRAGGFVWASAFVTRRLDRIPAFAGMTGGVGVTSGLASNTTVIPGLVPGIHCSAC